MSGATEEVVVPWLFKRVRRSLEAQLCWQGLDQHREVLQDGSLEGEEAFVERGCQWFSGVWFKSV